MEISDQVQVYCNLDTHNFRLYLGTPYINWAGLIKTIWAPFLIMSCHGNTAQVLPI